MKKSKKLISLFMAIFMVLSVFQVGLTTFATESTVTLKPINYTIIERPAVQISATDVTRVAAAANSQENGNVIVKATPSGVPELTGSFSSAAYAGETPQATAITLTTDVLVTGVSISCKSNNTVTFADPTLVGKTYKWTVTGGTANAGETLVFEVTYQYKDKTYRSYAYSYVENISQPAGTAIYTENYRKKWYDTHRYFATVRYNSRIIGKGVYGAPLDAAARFGYYNAATDAFVEAGSAAGYNIFKFEETGKDEETRTWNLANAVAAEIYIDKSVTSTLADINLRMTMHFGDMGRDHTRINKTYDLIDVYSKNGVASAENTTASDTSAETVLNLGSSKKTSGIGINGDVVVPFLGSGFTDASVFSVVPHVYSKTDDQNDGQNNTKAPITIKFHVVDKAALRQQINYVLSTDPTNENWNNIGKGSNPQSWYYTSGMSDFQTALTESFEVLNNPRAPQSEIDAAKQSLNNAYGNLVLSSANYSAVDALMIQAEDCFADAQFYSQSSIALLTQAYQEVKTGCSILYQDAVDTMAENLQTAISNLDLLDGDYTAVNTAVERANALVPAYYSNFSLVTDALAAVIRDLDITKQTEIDNMANNINTAIDALIELPADYTQVNEIKQDAMAFMSSQAKYYTNESTNVVRAAINAVKTGYLISQQAIVDGWGQAILDARAALVPKPATMTPLTNALAKIPPLSSENYDTALYVSWMNYYAECTTYSNRTDLNIFNNDEIVSMANELNARYDALIAGPADPLVVKLEELTAIVNTALDYESAFYTDLSFAVYAQAIQTAQALLERTDLTADDIPAIEQAGADIVDAINALVLKSADYSDFSNAVDAVRNELNETIDVKSIVLAGEYLVIGEEVLPAYSETDIASVNAVLDSYNMDLTIADQATVDAYTAEISTLLDGYNKVVYKQYLGDAATIYDNDFTSELFDTTTEGWATYSAANDTVLALVADEDATQSQINDAIVNFYDARNAIAATPEIIPVDGSTTVIDENRGFIYGLTEGVFNLDDYVNAFGGELVYHPTEAGFGTGTTVDFVVGGEVVSTYTIVIFGDISGDGVIDAFDQTFLTSVTNFEAEIAMGSAHELAGDVNGDGVVDAFDLSIITSSVNFELTIDQGGTSY